MNEKACLVFVAAMNADAIKLRTKLEQEGYDVCSTEVAYEDAIAAKDGKGELSSEIDACLMGAKLKIFLLPAKETPAGLLGAAGVAAKMPGRLVGLCATGASVPQIFDEMANSVANINSPALMEAITSKDVHESINGSPKSPRAPARVKCQ